MSIRRDYIKKTVNEAARNCHSCLLPFAKASMHYIQGMPRLYKNLAVYHQAGKIVEKMQEALCRKERKRFLLSCIFFFIAYIQIPKKRFSCYNIEHGGVSSMAEH